MAAPAASAAPRVAALTASLMCLLCALSATLAECDCDSDQDAAQPLGNSVLSRRPAMGGATPWATSALDDVLTPELVQSYLVLQLHRAALDMVDRERRSAGAAPCEGGAGAPLRRTKRLAVGDVPVVVGLAGAPGAGRPSAASLVALRPRPVGSASDDSNDVPVFKGNHEGSPLIHVVTPPPVARANARGGLRATTVPTVPVVKGSPDPAHPTTPRVALLPGDLELTPEEEEALSVLLEGRHKKPPAPTARPGRPGPRPLRPTSTPTVTAVSGKVGSKPSSPPAVSSRRGGSAGDGASSDCCQQKRLIQELERQLTLLRRLNADHLREEWVRASYPSPYYPYLHNLPVHPSRGYDGAPAVPVPFPAHLPPSAWRHRVPPLPPAWRSPAECGWSAGPPAGVPDDDDDDDDEEDGGELDDKVRFGEQSEQLREVDDLRGADPHDDVGVDPKIGEPVDFEVRRR